MSAAKHRVASSLLLWVAVIAGCSRWAHKPRYGSLVQEGRRFEFKHGIELLHAKNGMTFALLRNDRTNLVTVDVRYQVGSAEDPPGRAGMAHLAEHLLFAARLAKDGPTIGDLLGEKTLDYNAWTNADETHYTSVAVASQLTAVLALEAKRLAVSCEQIPEALFARERDVVLQEEAVRHGVDDPARTEILEALWGKQHPYARSPGSREIADATRDEVCAFIEKHYAPDRAILVVTGKLDVDTTSTVLAKLFGPLSRHSSASRTAITAAVLDGSTSTHLADVDRAGALIFFAAPPFGSPEVAPWNIVGIFLASELKDLDDEYPWIKDIAVGEVGGHRARATMVWISVDDPRRLDKAVKLVFEKVRDLGERGDWSATPGLIARERTDMMGRWDDFLSRPVWLADYLQYTDDDRFFLRDLAQLDQVTADQLMKWARSNLVRAKSHVALVRPSGKEPHGDRVDLTTTPRVRDVPRSRVAVDPGEAPGALAADLATRVETPLVEDVLDNGLRVLLAPDPDDPIVEARLVYPVGTSADPADRRGVALLTSNLLDNDIESYSDESDYDKLRWVVGLGTQMTNAVDELSTTFQARGLSVFADWHVWRLFWLLDQGVYSDQSLDAVREHLDAFEDQAGDVRGQALRTRLFGKGHPFAVPPATAAEVGRIDAGALERFRRTRYHARGATLIVVGGFDAEKMRKEVRELFGSWKGDAAPATPTVPPPRPAVGPSWIGVRDPDEPQPHVTIGFATASDPEHDRAARAVLAAMLEDRMGGGREGMAASHEIDVGYGHGAGGGLVYVDAYVDPAQLANVLKQMIGEIAALRDGAASAAEDFVRARRRTFARQLAAAAAAADLARELDFIASHRLPLGYFDAAADAIAAVTPAQVAAVATADLAEARMAVVVSGRAPVVTGAFEVLGVKGELFDTK